MADNPVEDQDTASDQSKTGPDQITTRVSGAEESASDRILNSVSARAFEKWYKELEFARNIRQGTPFFNGPSGTGPPEKHSPSSLLQCHRKVVYREFNAPEETPDPKGIFWIGSQFEEEIAVPFLRQTVTGDDEYVTNSMWVDFTERTDAGEIRIKGETDPVIVDRDGEPLLLTEIKTKQSVGDLSAPSRHHVAQAHAYMKGLTESYDRRVTNALIIYGSRESLEIQPFEVEFDPWFWSQSVVQWAASNTRYRIEDELPPATPEFGWECKFCSFQERCGEGETEYADVGPSGLIPGLEDYPREKVADYLEAHESAKLTPTLAELYPSLAERHGVYDWQCAGCGATFSQDDIDQGDRKDRSCPSCKREGEESQLKGPEPEDQHVDTAGWSRGGGHS
jgi:CRISPR/Cas system-associated exonuclease Cas4 (RecB family)